MRIGVIGGGQLGMMLGEAARNVSIACEFLDPSPDAPAGMVGPLTVASYDDLEALKAMAGRCDAITYEFENVPVDALRELAGHCTVHPSLDALAAAQDRLAEKKLFGSLSIPLPAYQPIDSAEDAALAIERLGFPMIIKTRRFGYDGKGQVRASSEDDVLAAVAELGPEGLIAEAFVPFDREVSAIATRSTDGDIAFYGLTENTHRDGILDTSVAPAGDTNLTEQARQFVESLLTHFDYVGTLALELFVQGDRLLANEFAPRVHNSGHWTIEGTRCSQFENHMRAVAGLELGDPSTTSPSAMKNIIGTMPSGLDALDSVFFHDYGKSERPGRKLAHLTITAESEAARDERLRELGSLIDVT